MCLRAYASQYSVKLPFWDEQTRLALRSNVMTGIAAAQEEQVRFAQRMSLGSMAESAATAGAGVKVSSSSGGDGGLGFGFFGLGQVMASFKEEQRRYAERMYGRGGGGGGGGGGGAKGASAAAKGDVRLHQVDGEVFSVRYD